MPAAIIMKLPVCSAGSAMLHEPLPDNLAVCVYVCVGEHSKSPSILYIYPNLKGGVFRCAGRGSCLVKKTRENNVCRRRRAQAA